MLRYFMGVSRELCVNIVINFLRIIRTRVINLIWTYRLHINTTLASFLCDLHIPANECGSLGKVGHFCYLYSNYRTCVSKKYIHKHLCFSLVSCFEIETNTGRWSIENLKTPGGDSLDLTHLSECPVPRARFSNTSRFFNASSLIFLKKTCYSGLLLCCRIMPRMDRQHVRVISGIILLIVIRCSYCQDFATDAPKDPQTEGISTTHEANGAENSPSLGMTVSKMCT